MPAVILKVASGFDKDLSIRWALQPTSLKYQFPPDVVTVDSPIFLGDFTQWSEGNRTPLYDLQTLSAANPK